MSNGKEGPLLVHVGRLGAEKNIKSIRGMMESIPNCCLAIVGTLQSCSLPLMNIWYCNTMALALDGYHQERMYTYAPGGRQVR